MPYDWSKEISEIEAVFAASTTRINRLNFQILLDVIHLTQSEFLFLAAMYLIGTHLILNRELPPEILHWFNRNVQLLICLYQIAGCNFLYGAVMHRILTLLIENPNIPTAILYWLQRIFYRLRFYLGRITYIFIRFFRRMTNIRIPYDVSRNLRIYGGLAVVVSVGFSHIFNMYRLYFLRTERAALHSRISYFTSIVFEMIFLSFSQFLHNGHIRYRGNWFTLGTVPGLILLRFPELWNRTYIIHAVMSCASLTCQYWNVLSPLRVRARFNDGDVPRMPFRIFRPFANLSVLARMWEDDDPGEPEVEEPHEY